MLWLPTTFISVMAVIAPVFSKPVGRHVKVLITGAILAAGRRTVTAALRPMADRLHPTAAGDRCPCRRRGAGVHRPRQRSRSAPTPRSQTNVARRGAPARAASASPAPARRHSPAWSWLVTTRAAQGLSVRAPLRPRPDPPWTLTADCPPRRAPAAAGSPTRSAHGVRNAGRSSRSALILELQ
jgi:hypothetical protein